MSQVFDKELRRNSPHGTRPVGFCQTKGVFTGKKDRKNVKRETVTKGGNTADGGIEPHGVENTPEVFSNVETVVLF